jgi:hypothetical protein
MDTPLDLPVHYIQEHRDPFAADEPILVAWCEADEPCVKTRTQERVTCQDCIDCANIKRKK